MSRKREIKIELAQLRKSVIPELKKKLKALRSDRRRRLIEIKRDCLKQKKAAKTKAAAARKKLNQWIGKSKRKAAEICKSSETINRESLKAIDENLKEMAAAAEKVSKLRSEFRGLMPSARHQKSGRRSAEIKAECDDAVRRDLADYPELAELWQKVKHRIKATPRMTRTEAFWDFLHNHPEELDKLRAGQELKWEKELEAEYRARAEQSCSMALEEAQEEIIKLRAALAKFEEVPF